MGIENNLEHTRVSQLKQARDLHKQLNRKSMDSAWTVYCWGLRLSGGCRQGK